MSTIVNMTEYLEYVSNALEVISIKLVRDRADIDDDSKSFSPEYAHQVFKDNERIFGYKDLKVRIYYTAGPLNLYLGCKYRERVDEMSELKSDDVTGKISQLLTTGCYFTSIDEFCSKLAKDESFVPFGEMVDALSVTKNEKVRNFEFYKCDASTPGFIPFHTRLQTFLMWFVDAASYIDIDDPQWLFFVCYEKYTNSEGRTMYATVGYTTIYLYYAYPANIRPRISQMLVLPPFQKHGIGCKMIKIIYNWFKSDGKVIDITVEDQSEDFRRIRNLVDVGLCKDLPAFSAETIKYGFNKAMIKEANINFKINAKQCRTVYEILRLSHTNKKDRYDYMSYRVDIKKRLNIPYYRQLRELTKLEKVTGQSHDITSSILPSKIQRILQLTGEYGTVEDDYERILRKL